MIKYWLLPFAWMGIIFALSGDTNSARHVSTVLGPLVRWLFPHFSQEQVESGVFVLRKLGHLTEYAILAILIWRALGKPSSRKPRQWGWSRPAVVLGAIILYAITDELHQVFVPTRQGSVTDVFIDTFGGTLGLLLAWAAQRCLPARAAKTRVDSTTEVETNRTCAR